MRFGSFGALEIVIIVAVILLIFGARRLPEIGTSMGKGIRTFKTALMGEDEKGQSGPDREDERVANGKDNSRLS